MIATHIGQLIGNTPLVKIDLPDLPRHVSIYGKLEGNNPAGSVKDRPAYYMISKALESGQINKNSKLIEATSGNTGIALAMVASTLGINITLVMPANATPERVDTMKAYGAKVILTDADKSIEYSRALAEEKVNNEGYVMLNQFGNPNNPLAHYETTGPEIWKDTKGKITHFVATMGTTGTIMGTSRFLKEQNKDVQIIGVQPEEGAKIPGIRKWSDAYLPSIYNPKNIDEIQLVGQENALQTSRTLAKDFGIFAGMSSGGSVYTAYQIAKNLPENQQACLVCIICDRGDRYLSSPLYNSGK
ncbi:MAG: cysteine synthase CysM [Flavobacteriaceae bacterium]|nr:cysteine synthase CysM [Flavobacteriaceae bacterium]|tara:strand:- start:98885 stop:99790 length:906 start_codon:yes stop_codon:yes gene_type:complete